MRLREAVEKYKAMADGYGRPVALSAFGLSRAETEKLFGELEEDYQISRFFHFSKQGGEAYAIDGFPQTHISIDAEIESAL
jgi:hypothetical protein